MTQNNPTKAELGTSITTHNEWGRSGSRFYPQTRADKFPLLPSGLYTAHFPPSGFYMERTADRFEFPFKVYNASGPVVDRVCKHWNFHGGTLGILLNGLRGAGKSVTAKLISNQALDEHDLPVLVVRNPIPLEQVFAAVQQDMVIIFDEFEKTHDENMHPGCQQQLLSTIDGMSKSEFNRLIIFTTNNSELNENFKDRPSRIHYRFEFFRIAEAIIEGLVDDLLPEHLVKLKPDIIQYLSTRDICTIDIVRATLREVVAFEESPLEFEDIINVEKSPPPSFTVEIVDYDTGAVVETLSSLWKLNHHETAWTPALAGNPRGFDSLDPEYDNFQLTYQAYDGSIIVDIVEPCIQANGTPEPGCFLAKVCVPMRRTFWNDYPLDGGGYGYGYARGSFWMDSPDDDWEKLPPPAVVKADKEGEIQQKMYECFSKCQQANQTVHGSGNPGIFKVRFTPNSERMKFKPSKWHK